jgi:quinol monooxygenase YgiN
MTQKNTQLVCVATFLAKEGCEELLLAELAALMPPTRREEGCIRYELNRSMSEPRRFVFIEKFNDDKQFDLHARTPYVTRLLEEVIPKLVETSDIHTYREIVP